MPSSIRKQGNTVVVDVEGKLAIGAGVDDFRAKWSEALASGSKVVIVNLTNVPMVDSSGIGTLIRCHSALTSVGGKMKVVGANSVVLHALKVTRLDRVFELHDNEASALASAGASA
jgi:anti-anti-sigma factor